MSTALPAAFTPASLDYVALLPVLIVFGAAMLGVLVEAFLPRSARYAAHVGITLVGLVAAMGALAFGAVSHRVATAGLAGVGAPAITASGERSSTRPRSYSSAVVDASPRIASCST